MQRCNVRRWYVLIIWDGIVAAVVRRSEWININGYRLSSTLIHSVDSFRKKKKPQLIMPYNRFRNGANFWLEIWSCCFSSNFRCYLGYFQTVLRFNYLEQNNRSDEQNIFPRSASFSHMWNRPPVFYSIVFISHSNKMMSAIPKSQKRQTRY